MQDLLLHERMKITRDVWIMRVPGGLIYEHWHGGGQHGPNNISTTFVPYDKFNP